MEEIFKTLTNEELIDVAKRFKNTYFEDDDPLRIIASMVYQVKPQDVNVGHILNIAPSLAIELAKRLEKCN